MTEDLRVYVAVAVEGESDTGMVQALLRHVHLTSIFTAKIESFD